MSATTIPARLRYLTDSAHLLVTNSPSTSAYLMARCNDLMFDNDLNPNDNQKRHVCGACGNILILGWTATRQIEALRAQQGKRKAKSKMQQSPSAEIRTVVYTCGRCNRRTRQNVVTNASMPPKNDDTVQLLQTPQAATLLRASASERQSGTKTVSSNSANASSKKRAKIRKQGGLLAVLAKKQDIDTRGSSGGFGLDLFDLMKKA